MAATTAVETRNKELAKNAWGLLKSMEQSIGAVLPKHLPPARMATIAFTAMRRNPKLMECSRESIIGSMMTAAMLGLEPSGPLGHGALIPYKGECQFQPMYQGLLELARRSGFIKDVQCRAVYKGDAYKYAFGLEPTIEHVPMEGEGAADPDRECTHVYCIIRFTNGGVQWDQMSTAAAIAHAKRFSASWNTREHPNKFKPGSPWAEHPVAMAMKTILKQTLKLCPKSPEVAQAMQLDDMAEIGRMATMKRQEDGTFDIEFDLGEEPAAKQAAAGLDGLVADAKKDAPAATATPAPTEAPLDQNRKCGDAEFVAIETLAAENGLQMSTVRTHVKKEMGIPVYSQLPASRLQELMDWIKGANSPNGTN